MRKIFSFVSVNAVLGLNLATYCIELGNHCICPATLSADQIMLDFTISTTFSVKINLNQQDENISKSKSPIQDSRTFSGSVFKSMTQ